MRPKASKGPHKADIIATNEKMQQKTSSSCNNLKKTRSFAKKPKQVQLNIKKVLITN
jgi:hypothetical protein